MRGLLELQGTELATALVMQQTDQPPIAAQALESQPRKAFAAIFLSHARDLLKHLKYVALFLTIFAARLWMINEFGSPVPIADEWHGEAANILKPYVEHTLGLDMLFALHNEHRPFVSRLLTLALFRCNNHQWDTRLEMMVSAALSALLGILFAHGARRLLPAVKYHNLIDVSVVLLLTLPYAYENMLMGWQSSFYFLFLFSVVGIWGVGFHDPFTRSWWLGVLLLFAACFTLASGFVAAAVILGLELVRMARAKRLFKGRRLASFVLCSAVIALGLFLRVEHAHNAFMKPQSLTEGSLCFARYLCWPYYMQPVMYEPATVRLMPLLATLLYLPALVLGILWLRSGRQASETEMLIGLQAWVLIQTAIIVYARGHVSPYPTSRYMEILALGTFFNVLAAMFLTYSLGGWWRRVTAVGAAAFVLLVLLGVVRLAAWNFTDTLPARRIAARNWLHNVSGYVNTRNAKYLEDQSPMSIPEPASSLAELLDDPTIRNFLPAQVRPFLRVGKAAGEANVFVPNGFDPRTPKPPSYVQTWGSFSRFRNSASGFFLSKPMYTQFPYLRWEVAGYLGQQNLSLALRSNKQATHQTALRPASPAREHWNTDYVPVPGSEFTIIAEDRDPNSWFAFCAPVELGRLSYWAEWLTGRSKICFCVTVGLTLLLRLYGFFFRADGQVL